MTPWTDEHLEDLLTASFTAHEADADPAVAQRIALTTAPVPRRTWPVVVAAAAAAALVIAIGVQALRPDNGRPTPSRPATTPTEVGDNRAVASAEATELLSTAPVPAVATPAPAREARLKGQIGDVDSSLTQTGWWIVPMSYGAVADWYRSHAPEEAASEKLLWWTEPGTPAYTQPSIIVSYARLGPNRTRIRIDVTIAARDDRTAATYVPGDVTSVDVTRSVHMGSDRPQPVTITVADPARLRAIVAAFNALDGAAAGAEPHPCGSPTGGYRWYDLSFHWPGHTLVVDTGEALCGVGRSLVLDGTTLPARLEDTDAFHAVLAAAF